ncbi:hypothetical protein LEMLEM_LOCUS21238, partial [Lemmus lemmus]
MTRSDPEKMSSEFLLCFCTYSFSWPLPNPTD